MHRQALTGGGLVPRCLPWLVALGVCWLVFQAGAPLEGAQASDSSAVTVGIDADPTGTPANTGNTLGSIESCRSVNKWDTFSVDFWVKDIPSPGIEGFQGTLNYDPTRLNVTWYDVIVLRGSPPPPSTPTPTPTAGPARHLMLAYNSGSNVTDWTPTGEGQQDHLPDADGTFTPVAYDFGTAQGHTETGSGVLARITLYAIANGTSQLTLTNVKLLDPANPPNYFGDTNGDGIFDGPISNAEIRIGEPCPAATATPTSTATPSSTATATRTPTPTATATSTTTATPTSSGTATPTRTPGSGPPVGGIAELPALPATSGSEAGSPTGRSGWSAGGYAAVVGGVVAVAAAAGGISYARRRRLR
jgi:hypothetical protein